MYEHKKLNRHGFSLMVLLWKYWIELRGLGICVLFGYVWIVLSYNVYRFKYIYMDITNNIICIDI
jgi:hypothetical protein